ncbi:MAG: LysM peptidoglycan-binding domain-containing protein [Candidatus Marinimicrobia bacterium]|nr:LysM peptidoglycan-binding domain-containing protein [Candidatus Neomarinimicrobiota bacterium]
MRRFRFLLTIATITFIFVACAKQAVVEEPVVTEKPQVEKQAQPVVEQKVEKIEDALTAVAEEDTIEIFYMVKPNDWLSKIAQNEYGDKSKWKLIYKWNKKKIGNNPNLIFPYHEFLLKKEKENANPLKYEFYEYTVKKNETLWSIAGQEYQNNYAWIVILRDNATVLGSELDNIVPGTVLKLRTKLYN